MSNQTELYRYYDKNDVLLYVGISKSTIARASQHQSTSHWYSKHTTIKTERFNTRYEALEAEKKAIKAEKPIHNINHNGKFKKKIAKKKPFKLMRIYDRDGVLSHVLVDANKKAKRNAADSPRKNEAVIDFNMDNVVYEYFDSKEELYAARMEVLIKERPYAKTNYNDPVKLAKALSTAE